MSGRIYTFYSWKGGVGRTMALANVGVQLARRGKRVLLVDWDLEAPGLDRYFAPLDKVTASQLSVKVAADQSGLVGLLDDAAKPGSSSKVGAWRRRCTKVKLPKLPPSLLAASAGIAPKLLHLLGSGMGSPNYAERLQTFSWEAFFADGRGGQVLETLRDQWRDEYDFILIDSRTGLTDSGGVCTVQMPDALVFVFTANTQSLDDGLAFLNGVHAARAAFAYERAPLTVVPLLARWEGDREVDLADSWLDRMGPMIEPLVESWLPSDLPIRRMLERLRVPHVARFSFGEPLPVLTHSLSDPDRPGLAYEMLAELLARGFADAGEVIEPGYRPPFDLEHATEAEIDGLVLDDHARKAVENHLRETRGADSPLMIDLLLELAEGGLRVGRTVLADQWAGSAVSIARGRARERTDSAADQAMLARALMVQGNVRRALGSLVDALFAYRESLESRRRLAQADPSNTSWQRDLSMSLEKLGDMQSAQGDLSGALVSYRESLATRQRLAEADPSSADRQRDVSMSLEKLGDVQSARGDLSGALASYHESLATRQRLAEADPSNASWQRDVSVSLNDVGDVQSAQGDLSGALTSYQESLAMRRRMVEADPSNIGWQRQVSTSLDRIGDVQSVQGNLSGALASYRESLAIRRRLAEADLSNAGWQHDLSATLDRIGDVQSAQGDRLGALASYREALIGARRSAEIDPSNAGCQRDLSVSLIKVGNAQSAQGDLSDALVSYYESLAVARRLAEADPSNAGWQRDLGVSLVKVGDVRRAQGELSDALMSYRESLAVARRLAEADPSNAGWQRDLSVSLIKVGDVQCDQGDISGALAAHRESLAVIERLVEADPSNADSQRNHAVTLMRLASLHSRQGDVDVAMPLARECLSISERLSVLDPTNVDWKRDVEFSRALVDWLQETK